MKNKYRTPIQYVIGSQHFYAHIHKKSTYGIFNYFLNRGDLLVRFDYIYIYILISKMLAQRYHKKMLECNKNNHKSTKRL